MQIKKKNSRLGNILWGTMMTLVLMVLGTICFAVYHLGDMNHQLDKITVAELSDASKPTPKSAYEGYGETCVLEIWNYPSQYQGIQDWKDHDPNAARSGVVESPYSKDCEKNFNPNNPSVPFTGMDYGFDYQTRAEDIYMNSAA
jgi:hypothetical protein